MMEKNSSLRDRFPLITEEDKAFAEDLADRFGLPIKDLLTFMWEIRWSIVTGGTVRKGMISKIIDLHVGGSQFKNESLRIFKHDFTIQNITIDTDKGKLEFKPTDPFFDHFIPAIKKIKTKVRDEHNRSKKLIGKMNRSTTLSHIFEFFYNRGLPNKSTILFATGLCMIHFQLYGYKPILKEQDFTEDYGASDYKHYLIDNVKRRLHKLIHRTYIDDPEFEKFETTDEYKKWLQSLEDDDDDYDIII